MHVCFTLFNSVYLIWDVKERHFQQDIMFNFQSESPPRPLHLFYFYVMFETWKNTILL